MNQIVSDLIQFDSTKRTRLSNASAGFLLAAKRCLRSSSGGDQVCGRIHLLRHKKSPVVAGD